MVRVSNAMTRCAQRLLHVTICLTLCTGGHKSPYTALGLLFPDAAPLIRWVATRLPDAALRKWLQVRLLCCSPFASAAVAPATASPLLLTLLLHSGKDMICFLVLALTAVCRPELQGRRIMRRICYSLIAEQAQSLQPQADSGDAAHDGPTDNLAAGDAAAGLQSSGGRAAAPDGELASEDTGRAAAEPVGRGLIHHLLAAESKLIQRPLTDMEVCVVSSVLALHCRALFQLPGSLLLMLCCSVTHLEFPDNGQV